MAAYVIFLLIAPLNTIASSKLAKCKNAHTRRNWLERKQESQPAILSAKYLEEKTDSDWVPKKQGQHLLMKFFFN